MIIFLPSGTTTTPDPGTGRPKSPARTSQLRTRLGHQALVPRAKSNSGSGPRLLVFIIHITISSIDFSAHFFRPAVLGNEPSGSPGPINPDGIPVPFSRPGLRAKPAPPTRGKQRAPRAPRARVTAAQLPQAPPRGSPPPARTAAAVSPPQPQSPAWGRGGGVSPASSAISRVRWKTHLPF